jgi:hypothetical protein
METKDEFAVLDDHMRRLNDQAVIAVAASVDLTEILEAVVASAEQQSEMHDSSEEPPTA